MGESFAMAGAFAGPAAPIAMPVLGLVGGALGYYLGKGAVQETLNFGNRTIGNN